MIRFFALHPTAANLLMLLLMLTGIVTLPALKRETLPEIKQYEVEIKIAYPGATPQDIEQKLCSPLEDAIEGISFLEEIRCESRHSMVLVVAEMLETGDFRIFMDDIESAVDEIDSFPDDIEEPIIRELGRTQEVVTVALTAELKAQELKDLAEDIKQRMLRDPEIPLVTIEGFSDRQFQIQISQSRLRQYGLSLQDITSIIARQDLDLPVGDIHTKNRDYQIRFNDERRTVRDLAELFIIKGEQGHEIRLGDIAKISDQFEDEDQSILYDGIPTAFLKIRKNSRDDSLRILEAVKKFIIEEKKHLPDQVGFHLTQDFTSGISDRIKMLISNSWQGLILVFFVMWLFFGGRYAFWVIMGLPVSFLASVFVLAQWGISINMLSMVALLLALGILMDDAIVISESIGHQMSLGKNPMQAAIEGTKLVASGVLSSYITTLCIFIGLLFLNGNIGQMLKTIPAVLISVISVSLIEAFLILPHHLMHSLQKAGKEQPHIIRQKFNQSFDRLHHGLTAVVENLITYRYAFIGAVIGSLLLSISLFAAGIVKFSAFPDVEGDILQARILMPVGSSKIQTEQVVLQVSKSLEKINSEYQNKFDEDLLKAITVNYGMNIDAFESGAHLATLSIDFLESDSRQWSLDEIAQQWHKTMGAIPDALNVTLKEPMIGPAGRAIYIRLQGDDLEQLSLASHQLQNWLAGYPGVSNLLDDLRPGKPEFTLQLLPSALSIGVDAQTIATQLRTAYQGTEILETSVDLETYEVTVLLDDESTDELADFDQFPVIHPQTGQAIPLSTVAKITPTRSYSRIQRINGQRTVTVYGDIDMQINNTQAVLKNLQQHYLPTLQNNFPELSFNFEGEVKEGTLTRNSMRRSMLLGLIGVFILLSVQFRSYLEPVLVMVNIPLAFIGVIWGHIIMGQDITMPSLLGFVSLVRVLKVPENYFSRRPSIKFIIAI